MISAPADCRARQVAGEEVLSRIHKERAMRMRNLSVVVVIAAALGAGMIHAQILHANGTHRQGGPTLKFSEVTGPGTSQGRSPRVSRRSPRLPARVGNPSTSNRPGSIYFDWPKDVKQVAFTVETTSADSATISAPGFTEANKAEYRAAFDAVVPLAISKAKAQRDGKTKYVASSNRSSSGALGAENGRSRRSLRVRPRRSWRAEQQIQAPASGGASPSPKNIGPTKVSAARNAHPTTAARRRQAVEAIGHAPRFGRAPT